jgi:hypothetical protein
MQEDIDSDISPNPVNSNLPPKGEDEKSEAQEQKTVWASLGVPDLKLGSGLSWADLCDETKDEPRLPFFTRKEITESVESGTVQIPQNFEKIFPRYFQYLEQAAKVAKFDIETSSRCIEGEISEIRFFQMEKKKALERLGTLRSSGNEHDARLRNNLISINDFFQGLIKFPEKLVAPTAGLNYSLRLWARAYWEERGYPAALTNRGLSHPESRNNLIAAFKEIMGGDGEFLFLTFEAISLRLFRRVIPLIEQGDNPTYPKKIARLSEKSISQLFYSVARRQREKKRVETKTKGRRETKVIDVVRVQHPIVKVAQDSSGAVLIPAEKASIETLNRHVNMTLRSKRVAEVIKSSGNPSSQCDRAGVILNRLYQLSSVPQMLIKQRLGAVRAEAYAIAKAEADKLNTKVKGVFTKQLWLQTAIRLVGTIDSDVIGSNISNYLGGVLSFENVLSFALDGAEFEEKEKRVIE